jgi:hypothetical protein
MTLLDSIFPINGVCNVMARGPARYVPSRFSLPVEIASDSLYIRLKLQNEHLSERSGSRTALPSYGSERSIFPTVTKAVAMSES